MTITKITRDPKFYYKENIYESILTFNVSLLSVIFPLSIMVTWCSIYSRKQNIMTQLKTKTSVIL